MSDMIRKQIYIHQRHDRLLKQLAETRGVSEAEVVRQAIEREAAPVDLPLGMRDQAAWQAILRFIEERDRLGGEGPAYHWRREDAYEEREERVK